MSTEERVPEVRKTVERLIENGSQFNVEALEQIYHQELQIVKIDETGNVTGVDRAENLDYFRHLRDTRSEPLNTAAEFNYVEQRGNRGHVIVTRRMKLQDRLEKSIFSIELVREDEKWQVIRETAFVEPVDDETPLEQ